MLTVLTIMRVFSLLTLLLKININFMMKPLQSLKNSESMLKQLKF